MAIIKGGSIKVVAIRLFIIKEIKIMKEKKNTSTNNATKDIRDGKKTYAGAFCGVNKYGIYVGLKEGEDNIEFISGYEAINFLNGLLNEFDRIDVLFGSKESKNGKTYEVAQAVDYKI